MSLHESTETKLTDAGNALSLVAPGMDGLVAPLFSVPGFQASE